MLLLLLEKCTYSLADTVISMNQSYKLFALNRGGKNESEVFVVRSAPKFQRDRNEVMAPEDDRDSR